MSLHTLDALNRQRDTQQYVSPIDPELAPRTLPTTPEQGVSHGIVERIRHFVGHLALNK